MRYPEKVWPAKVVALGVRVKEMKEKKKKERKERKKEKPKSLVSYSTVSIFDFCFNLFRDSAPPELVDARPPLYQRI